MADYDNNSVNEQGYISEGGPSFSNLQVKGSIVGSLKGVTIDDNLHRSPNRYYLEECFKRKPGVNGDIQDAAEGTRMIANPDFEITGQAATSDDTSFPGTIAGVQCQTDGNDDDAIVVSPHQDANQSAWALVLWGTENSVEWECALRTGAAITTVLHYAGLKLTTGGAVATDADQVFFRFSTDDTDTTWRAITSIGGVDTNTDSGIRVAAATIYRFRISIDESRVARFYINEQLVHTTAALTDDIDLVPHIGVQSLAGVAREHVLIYEKISRAHFE